MKVAIRDDDTSYFTKPKDLQRAYDFLNEDDCVSLSVVRIRFQFIEMMCFHMEKKLEWDIMI